MIADRAALNVALASFFDKYGNYDRERGSGPGSPGPLDNWDVSRVTDLSNLFYLQHYREVIYDYRALLSDVSWSRISDWDTSNVTKMKGTFRECSEFDQTLNWDTHNVDDMSFLFYKCDRFNNGGEPLEWDTVNVTNLAYMFYDCLTFNQPVPWVTTNVTDLTHTFDNCRMFNQPLAWDTANVEQMVGTFIFCSRFNQPLLWNTNRVVNFTEMFLECTVFNQKLPYSATINGVQTDTWTLTTVPTIRRLSNMFTLCAALSQLPFTLDRLPPITDKDDLETALSIFEGSGIEHRFERALNTWLRTHVIIPQYEQQDAAEAAYEHDPRQRWVRPSPSAS